jgi:hypothetical protein
VLQLVLLVSGERDTDKLGVPESDKREEGLTV